MTNKFDIKKEVEDSVRFCSEVMADMYNLTIERAKELLWNSPFPKLIAEDPISFGHFSFEDMSEETYKYHVRLGNIC